MQYFPSSFCSSSLVALVSNFPLVGFSGSRHPNSPAALACRQFVPLLGSYQGSVVVGCARGVDSLVRQQFPLAQVFKVQPPINRGAFAKRSARMVHHVAASSGLLVVFPSTACPQKVVPSTSFGGFGSGSWGSAALAIGLGVPVLLFVPSSSVLPAPSAAVPAGRQVACHFQLLGSAWGGSWWLAS